MTKLNDIYNDDMSVPAGRFMGSCRHIREASSVIVGAPVDLTCSYRQGARFGCQKIRDVSSGIEEFSYYSGKSLDDARYYDAGDLLISEGPIEKALETIGGFAGEILSAGLFPLFIGGEHSISIPVIKRVFEKYGNDLVVIQLDAHADLRDGYMGIPFSHASVIRRLTDFMPPVGIFQVGIRSGSAEEFKFASENTNMYPVEVIKPLRKIADIIGKRPVYATVDIDVADPAYANGTGAPEPGGISSKELIEAVMLISGMNLVGFDLVEVSPVYDISDRTALLAAVCIREILVGR